jgi:site-specific recombinase XerC
LRTTISGTLAARSTTAGIRKRPSLLTSKRDARWVIVDLIGKGRRVHTVPMPSWTEHAIGAWIAVVGIDSGFVFRRIGKSGRVIVESIRARSIFQIVNGAGTRIGVSSLCYQFR